VTEYDDQTIQICTDGSKNEQGIGAGVAIFSGQELVTKLQYNLDSKCSNNQAEQLAIAKDLEALETIDIEENSSRTAAIIMDNRKQKQNNLLQQNTFAYAVQGARRRNQTEMAKT
jgi:ribonuclease HI